MQPCAQAVLHFQVSALSTASGSTSFRMFSVWFLDLIFSFSLRAALVLACSFSLVVVVVLFLSLCQVPDKLLPIFQPPLFPAYCADIQRSGFYGFPLAKEGKGRAPPFLQLQYRCYLSRDLGAKGCACLQKSYKFVGSVLRSCTPVLCCRLLLLMFHFDSTFLYMFSAVSVEPALLSSRCVKSRKSRQRASIS